MPTFNGTPGNDIFTSYSGTEPLLARGFAGNDIIAGGSGNDTLYGGTGNDFLFDMGGNDLLRGGAGNDIFSGAAGGNDLLRGGAGNDIFSDAGGGNNTLTGGVGADSFQMIFQSSPVDPSTTIITDFSRNQGDKIGVYGTISNYSLNKTQNISGGSAIDTAIYRQNDLVGVLQDTTQASLFKNFFFIQSGGNGNDSLIGQATNDVLNGSNGSDFLDGAGGNDTLIGNSFPFGSGDTDTLTGGAGADTFKIWNFLDFVLNSPSYIITDFSRNQGDKIEFISNSDNISNYSLDKTQNLSGGSALDTAIYYQHNSFNYFVAVVQDTTQVSLSYDFIFS